MNIGFSMESVDKLFQTAFENGTVKAMMGTLKLSDEAAYYHSINVAEMVSKYLALTQEKGECEYTEEECIHIIEGALLHDVGRAFLPFNLQSSRENLPEYGFEIMKIHPLLGCVAVKNCELDEKVSNIILMHHANADGTGYPLLEQGAFTKENVPSYVWPIVYADRFIAMTTERPFKEAKSYPDAWRAIVDMSRNGVLPYQFAKTFGEMIQRESILHIEAYENTIESERGSTIAESDTADQSEREF